MGVYYLQYKPYEIINIAARPMLLKIYVLEASE